MKKRLMLFSILFLSHVALADDPAPTSAVQFGVQAGVVAGTAQACGIDTTMFAQRIGEALARISQDNADRAYASTAFQDSTNKTREQTVKRSALDCTEITKDFNSLPILRDDYADTVLSKMGPKVTEDRLKTGGETLPQTLAPAVPENVKQTTPFIPTRPEEVSSQPRPYNPAENPTLVTPVVPQGIGPAYPEQLSQPLQGPGFNQGPGYYQQPKNQGQPGQGQ